MYKTEERRRCARPGSQHVGEVFLFCGELGNLPSCLILDLVSPPLRSHTPLLPFQSSVPQRASSTSFPALRYLFLLHIGALPFFVSHSPHLSFAPFRSLLSLPSVLAFPIAVAVAVC